MRNPTRLYMQLRLLNFIGATHTLKRGYNPARQNQGSPRRVGNCKENCDREKARKILQQGYFHWPSTLCSFSQGVQLNKEEWVDAAASPEDSWRIVEKFHFLTIEEGLQQTHQSCQKFDLEKSIEDIITSNKVW